MSKSFWWWVESALVAVLIMAFAGLLVSIVSDCMAETLRNEFDFCVKQGISKEKCYEGTYVH